MTGYEFGARSARWGLSEWQESQASQPYSKSMRTVDAALEEKLRGLKSGTTEVLSAKVRHDEDSEGEPALFLELTLTNPPPGKETWPTDDIWALRRLVGDVVASIDKVTEPWFIRFYPKDPGELEPSDLEEQLDL